MAPTRGCFLHQTRVTELPPLDGNEKHLQKFDRSRGSLLAGTIWSLSEYGQIIVREMVY